MEFSDLFGGETVLLQALGRNVERVRDIKGLKQEEVARSARLKPQELADLEEGKCLPEKTKFNALVDALDVDDASSLFPEMEYEKLSDFASQGSFVTGFSATDDIKPGTPFVGVYWFVDGALEELCAKSSVTVPEDKIHAYTAKTLSR